MVIFGCTDDVDADASRSPLDDDIESTCVETSLPDGYPGQWKAVPTADVKIGLLAVSPITLTRVQLSRL